MTIVTDRHGEVRITCGDRAEAQRIADALIERRLAACVHLTPIASVYEWQGEVEHDEEILLNAITRADLLGRVAELVGELHSYDLPAVTMVPLTGSAAYLAWVDEQTDR